MADHMVGIIRYAREMTKALDGILNQSDDDAIILLPPGAKDVPELRHIKRYILEIKPE